MESNNNASSAEWQGVQSASRWADTLVVQRDEAFGNTRWSVVALAVSDSEADAGRALSYLCRNYWYPLYGYARRSGHSREAAEDLTQEFFARLLRDNTLAEARQHKGKLRTFLLTVMKRFMIKEWQRASAQKRGGGREHVPIDFDEGEERYSHEPADQQTPDEVFEKQWATTLLARVMESLRLDYVSRDMAERFEVLQDALWWNSNESSYAELATRLGMKENAVKQAVSRMRNQYRKLLKDEIKITLQAEDEDAVNEELACLIEVLRSN
jgi:RNA polymerase sigma-70 factor (ECF subfamily)